MVTNDYTKLQMGKHVHEEVTLEVDASAVTADADSSAEEKFRALVEALKDEDVEVTVSTETTVEDDDNTTDN